MRGLLPILLVALLAASVPVAADPVGDPAEDHVQSRECIVVDLPYVGIQCIPIIGSILEEAGDG